ncbi:MAG: hypothetical protein KatS3mg105_3290 [Gemmatales bacterium]|nr:MAG: hypothetical protein KatS3mg105_3290 [Gemmatales bacterium]
MSQTAYDRHSYDRHRRRAAEAQRQQSLQGRDIGEIPEPANPTRRRKATDSLLRFCESYFPHRFRLAWSSDHLRVIDRLEHAVLHGGLFALAMPRGSGKTTLCEVACIWATFCGHREFVALIGASKAHALEMMASIQSEVETNELLAEDWPEVCVPIQRLEGIGNRCRGQLYKGRRTQIIWKRDEIVLPTISHSKASGCILRVAGITGRIRGMKFARPDGRNVRPSLVIIDDPQTDKSARSLSQIEQREKVIAGAILGLAGPGEKIAAVCPCTVVRPGDLADRILDREIHPEWQGERMKLLYAFPKNEQLWLEYAEIRNHELRNGGDGREATRFYAANRSEMDFGAVVAWPERKQPDELSAIQHAMNLYLTDKYAFAAEYQNEPLAEEAEAGQLKAEQIAARVNGLPRRTVPLNASRLTCYVDVQQKALFYVVAAWSEDFTGAVIDYGTYPDQQRRYFTLNDLQKTLSRAASGSSLEGSIYFGLDQLADRLLGVEWLREDQTALRIERCLIDANWGASTEVIYTWSRRTPYAAIVMPAHGRYVGAASKPWSEYQKKPGEQLGHHWLISSASGKRAKRYCLIDTNYWKTFVADRLSMPMNDKGALTLFGKPGEDHRLFADHCCSEFRVRTEGRGRIVDEWKIRPEKFDNHWWDCLVGSAAAASILGSRAPGSEEPVKTRRRVKWSEVQRAKGGNPRL